MLRGESVSADVSAEGLSAGTTSADALRTQAISDLAALIRATAEARDDLLSYQSALETNHRHLVAGGTASDMAAVVNVAEVRISFTERLNIIERTRNSARLSLWRLQLSEGKTIADIARLWGFSRQLVSRALAARQPG